MSLDAAVAAITQAYRADAAFEGVVFPGDPAPGEYIDLQEQFNEWPVLVVFEDSGFSRIGSHASDAWWDVATIRIELHQPRQTGEGQNDAVTVLRQYRRHVSRVFYARWYGDRFAGTVVALGDVEARGGQAPLRWEMRPDDWGGVPTMSLVHFADITIEEGTEA